MDVVLTRRSSNFDDHCTVGELMVDGKYFSDTLEPAQSGQHPRIPAGTYELTLTYSNKFKRILPLVMRVLNREGIRIHPFNRASESLGCIGLGTLVGGDTIKGSAMCCNKFQTLLSQAMRHKKVFLTIK